MPFTITIDGERLSVPAGTTILEAARRLGRDIPTLCHRDEVEPVGSCFLCVVAVRDRPGLVPSCVARVEDGMEVTTDSPEIRAARRMALELLFSDHPGDCEASCTLACPAHLDIPGFLRHVAAGRPEAAARLIRRRIPLPGALGRICPAYCERACRRGQRDEPVAICAMKRHVPDREQQEGAAWLPERPEPTGRRVAIVGAGPAGLSAAYTLLSMGHACALYEARPQPGGMFRYAVPAYALPRDALEHEVEVIRRMGAEFHLNTALGREVTLEELRARHDAVLLATGAQADVPPGCPGAQAAIPALRFLEEVATGRRTDMAGGAVVVGDGQEALAAARSAVRLGAQPVTLLSGLSRARLTRQPGAQDAAEEGVTFETDAELVSLRQRDDGAVECAVRRPGGEMTLVGECVIAAGSRRVDVRGPARWGLEVEEGALSVDDAGRCRGAPDVFAAGEVTLGATWSVRAVAGAVGVAASVDQYLRGEPVVGERHLLCVRMGRVEPAVLEQLCRGYPETPRAEPQKLPAESRRGDFREVRPGLCAEAARQEARRCLNCDCRARDNCKLRIYGTEYGADLHRLDGESRGFERDDRHPELVYESGKCISCGLCVRISAAEDEELGMAFRNRGFGTRVGVPFDRPLSEGLTRATARCTEACPTGALAFKPEEVTG